MLSFEKQLQHFRFYKIHFTYEYLDEWLQHAGISKQLLLLLAREQPADIRRDLKFIQF